MTRTQVQLTGAQLESLRRRAAATGESISEIVRRGVDLYLSRESRDDREARVERAIRASGRFESSGPDDVSENHDLYLEKIYHSPVTRGQRNASAELPASRKMSRRPVRP